MHCVIMKRRVTCRKLGLREGNVKENARWRPGKAAGEGYTMRTASRPRAVHDTTSLAGRAFTAMFPRWDLTTVGRVHVAVPRGTPVIAGENLSEVVGQIRGAAVRGRCVPGTGWPERPLS